jgi:hypothetical protein
VLKFKSRRMRGFPVVVFEATGILRTRDLPRVAAFAAERVGTAEAAIWDMRTVIPFVAGAHELASPEVQAIHVPLGIVASEAHTDVLWDYTSMAAELGLLRQVFTDAGDAIFWACEQTRRWPAGYWESLRPRRQSLAEA